jgi:hypothetical protein
MTKNYRSITERRGDSYDERLAHNELHNHYSSLGCIIDSANTGSCSIRCDSRCCYFNRGGPTVQIESKLAERISRQLKARGLDGGRYLGQRAFSTLSEPLQECLNEKDYVFVKGGEKMVWEVKTTDVMIPDSLAWNLPRTCDGDSIWAGKDSRECAFLTKERLCMLQDWGLKPRVCKGFICSTSITLGVAKQLGYVDDLMLQGLSFTELKDMGDAALRAFNGSRMRELEAEFDKAFMELASAYASNRQISAPLSRFKEAEKKYLARRRALFQNIVKPGFLDYLRQLVS